MRVMKIQFNKKISLNKGLLAVPVFSEDIKKMSGQYPAVVKEFISTAVNLDGFKGAFGETIFAHIDSKDLPRKLLLIGAGSEKKFNAAKARLIGAKSAKLCKQLKSASISFLLLAELTKFVEELAEGLLLAQYDLGKFKSKKKNHSPLEKIELITSHDPKTLEDMVNKAEAIVETVGFVKDLVNSPSNFVDSDYMAKTAEKIAKENKYKITIFDKKDLTKMAWGGMLAVNQGARKEPRCIVLEYYGAKDHKEKPIVLIGKGVIFDTGGYNLKPINNIETMHQDMAGAADVFGVFQLLRKLGIKKNIIGITPIVENLVSSTAYRPSDIITMLSGQTVEITNTDAEGRLILADAITYGSRLNPAYMITIATLTGAVAVALGDRYAGIEGNDLKLSQSLVEAGKQVDELAWPLPMHDDFKKKFNSLVADMKNSDNGTSRYAGSSKGASFLSRFFGKNRWCHIDIGGTAFTSDPQEFQTRGATAHGLRLLVKFLENL